VTYRGYLLTVDAAMRQQIVRTAIAFDATRGTWTRGKHIVRSNEAGGTSIRFQLFTSGTAETLVGSYSGTIGTQPDEVAHFLVYFLETGTPWHQGLPNRGRV
jgi:hypothetical protein